MASRAEQRKQVFHFNSTKKVAQLGKVIARMQGVLEDINLACTDVSSQYAHFFQEMAAQYDHKINEFHQEEENYNAESFQKIAAEFTIAPLSNTTPQLQKLEKTVRQSVKSINTEVRKISTSLSNEIESQSKKFDGQLNALQLAQQKSVTSDPSLTSILDKTQAHQDVHQQRITEMENNQNETIEKVKIAKPKVHLDIAPLRMSLASLKEDMHYLKLPKYDIQKLQEQAETAKQTLAERFASFAKQSSQIEGKIAAFAKSSRDEISSLTAAMNEAAHKREQETARLNMQRDFQLATFELLSLPSFFSNQYLDLLATFQSNFDQANADLAKKKQLVLKGGDELRDLKQTLADINAGHQSRLAELSGTLQDPTQRALNEQQENEYIAAKLDSDSRATQLQEKNEEVVAALQTRLAKNADETEKTLRSSFPPLDMLNSQYQAEFDTAAAELGSIKDPESSALKDLAAELEELKHSHMTTRLGMSKRRSDFEDECLERVKDENTRHIAAMSGADSQPHEIQELHTKIDAVRQDNAGLRAISQDLAGFLMKSAKTIESLRRSSFEKESALKHDHAASIDAIRRETQSQHTESINFERHFASQTKHSKLELTAVGPKYTKLLQEMKQSMNAAMSQMKLDHLDKMDSVMVELVTLKETLERHEAKYDEDRIMQESKHNVELDDNAKLWEQELGFKRDELDGMRGFLEEREEVIRARREKANRNSTETIASLESELKRVSQELARLTKELGSCKQLLKDRDKAYSEKFKGSKKL